VIISDDTDVNVQSETDNFEFTKSSSTTSSEQAEFESGQQGAPERLATFTQQTEESESKQESEVPALIKESPLEEDDLELEVEESPQKFSIGESGDSGENGE